MRSKDEILLSEAVEDALSSWNRIQGKNDHYNRILGDLYKENGPDAAYTSNGQLKPSGKKANWFKIKQLSDKKFELNDWLGWKAFYKDFNREKEIDEVLEFVQKLQLVPADIAKEEIEKYNEMIRSHETKAKDHYDKHIKGTPAEYYTRNPHTGRTPYSGD
jgi:hypothetical protein